MAYDIRPYTAYVQHEILPLYESVGWKAYTRNPEALRRAFEKSLHTLAAYKGDQPVGILRTVGDGETVLFIQDLLVHPDHRRKGIATALIQSVLETFSHVRQIQLTADDTPEMLAFYESVGFRPHSAFGCIGFMHFNK